jgi:octaprenyl-diphosphate synthase
MKTIKKVAELIELVKENGGLNYAENVMIEYRNEALEILNQFDDNEARRSLELLLNYVVNRKK